MNTDILRGGRLLSVVLLVTVVVSLLPSGARAAQEDKVAIKGIPQVSQWYNLSCEYAAAAAVTLYWGDLVSQRDFVREVPTNPNPHKGFRGDINGSGGGINNYGIYAEPLVPVLERRGYNADVFYGGASTLKGYIRSGVPVVAWLTIGRDVPRPVYRRSYEGETFKLVPFEHAVVVYGYDSDGIYSMDVQDGSYAYTGWDSFLRRWGYFDQMALAIYPK